VTSTSAKGFSLLELVIVLGVMGVLVAVAVPRMGTVHSADDTRAISNALSLAKLRAASNFSQSRLYVDLTARAHHVEWWQKTPAPGAWVALNGPTLLTTGDAFAFAPVNAAPPNTQAAIAQGPACLDAALAAIASTACVVFNSRGIPVDATGAPTNNDAVYVTDGTVVGAVTISSAGLISVWSTRSSATPTWAHK
jgi:prepilin-type N-terminal cleavage/methylation domain-containing protein